MVHDGSELEPKVNGKGLQVIQEQTVIQDKHTKSKEDNSMHLQAIGCELRSCSGHHVSAHTTQVQYTASLSKKERMNCQKELNLDFIKHLYITTSVQDIQETEEFAKQHSEEERSQIHKVGNSMGQVDSFNLEMTLKT